MNSLRTKEKHFLCRSLLFFSMAVLPFYTHQTVSSENMEFTPANSRLISPEFGIILQERTGTIRVDRANVRESARIESDIVTTLRRNDTVTILSLIRGDSVTSAGVASSRWFHVQLANGEQGYIWSPLVNETTVTTPDESIFGSANLLQHCDFVPEVIYAFFTDGTQKNEHAVKVTPDEAVSRFGEIPARSIWLGYEDEVPEGEPSGFDHPSDVQDFGTIRLGLGENRQELRFLYSYSTKQVFVLPFDSFDLFPDANGDHFGFHPCGAYEIPTDEFYAFLDSILVDASEFIWILQNKQPPQKKGVLTV